MGYFKDLRKKTLPEDKKNEVKTDLIAYYIIRPLGDIFTYPFLKLKISATAVTKLSLLFIMAMYILFIFGNNIQFYFIATICLFIWDILDAVDGNIARYTDTCSPNGGLWDATVGWIAVYFFFSAMGIIAYREGSLFEFSFIPKYFYIIMGDIAGFSLLFARLVMHKKAGLYGNDKIKAAKERANYGIIKKIVFNITSINGFAMIFFIVALFTNTTNILTIMYTLLNVLIGIGMIYKLLKKGEDE